MLVTSAFAQDGADPGGNILITLGPFVLIFVVFYFLLIRPQQKRMRAHQQMIANLKRGDNVITSGGLIGKIKSVADDEVRIELAPNVEVRAVRSTISGVRDKTSPPPANDSKPASAG